jgi:hypothetical protein
LRENLGLPRFLNPHTPADSVGGSSHADRT